MDCVSDENVRPVSDAGGNYNVVVSRAPGRPANAKEACGAVWMEHGNGDGIPGGSADDGVVINRRTPVNPKFQQSWFDVKTAHGEADALGDYLPHVINMHEKARFAALGCPLDTGKLAAMLSGP